MPPSGEVKAQTTPGDGENVGALRIAVAGPKCDPVDWSSPELTPLLTREGGRKSDATGKVGVREEIFGEICTDAPQREVATSAPPAVIDGVRISVAGVAPAGKSGRNWFGNHCQFEVALADGTGRSVLLSAERIPPSNTINAVLRLGSAVWLSVGFNGYSREFPKGGNRIIALDLCVGRVVWQSKDATSNGGLLLLDDYLISAYGFTSERRYVYVLNAHSGKVVQKLPVLENVCPSKTWAPHWHEGDLCDRPGQLVGAATNPRIESGSLVVDTNTGSSTFDFLRTPSAQDGHEDERD
ncbi:MAG: hypothetical protein QM784_01090 [Polyangiaceae bacterium]